MRRRIPVLCNQLSVADTVTEMTFAWRSTLDEAGQETAARWARSHESLTGGEALLADLAIAVMEDGCGANPGSGTPGEARRLGERLGQCLYTQGSTLADLEQALDDLRDDLFELGRVAVGREGDARPDPRDVLELAARLEHAMADARRGATESYAAALAAELRARYRALRHEMRNSLGTIRTSLALMSDESLPEETRRHPRLRDMLGRNAHFLDSLILDALSDAAASGVLARLASADTADGVDREGGRGSPRLSGSEFGQDFGRGNERADLQPRVL